MEIIVDSANLAMILKSIKNFYCKDETRLIYKNVRIEVLNNNIRIIACDGYKLAYNSCEIIKGDNCNFIIPFFNIPKYASKNTIFFVEEESVTIDFGCYKISFKKVKEHFFDYKILTERKCETYKIAFNPKLLKKAFESFNDIVELEFDLNDNASAVIITNVKNKNNKAVVLPYKLNEKDYN